MPGTLPSSVVPDRSSPPVAVSERHHLQPRGSKGEHFNQVLVLLTAPRVHTSPLVLAMISMSDIKAIGGPKSSNEFPTGPPTSECSRAGDASLYQDHTSISKRLSCCSGPPSTHQLVIQTGLNNTGWAAPVHPVNSVPLTQVIRQWYQAHSTITDEHYSGLCTGIPSSM